jgi:hypothetical protein
MNFFDKCLPNENGCWIWQKAIKKTGHSYGWLTYGGKQTTAHRVAWQKTYGEIPKDKCVCHKCDVPQCINPDHLFLGTHAENIQDMWDKKRHPKPKPNNKLSFEQVLEIKELIKKGLPQLKIAEIYKVKQATISLINTNKTWSK